MNEAEIQVGDVRKYSTPAIPGMIEEQSHVMRIILADDHEVMYDGWDEYAQDGRGDWSYARARSVSYCRVPVSYVSEQTTLLRREPLSDKEREKHRPDLPLRLLRKTGWSFNANSYATLTEFIEEARRAGVDTDRLEATTALPISRVWLRPLGPHGGDKPAELVQARSASGFTGCELLWRAHQLQAPHVRDWWNGAGIYRTGLSRSEPCYYIGCDKDLAGIAPD